MYKPCPVSPGLNPWAFEKHSAHLRGRGKREEQPFIVLARVGGQNALPSPAVQRRELKQKVQ